MDKDTGNQPNHFHGIVIIGENEYNRRDDPWRQYTNVKRETK